MLKRTSRVVIALLALILAAGVIVTGCKKGPNLKGASVVIASWSNAYNVNTAQPRNEGEEKELEWRKKVLADNGLHMEIVELSGWDDYFPLVVSNIMSGNKEYSLYCLAADWAMTLYKQGLLFPISDSSVKLNNRVPVEGEKGAWNKMMEDLFTINGKQYAVCPGIGGFSWQGNFVFFNKRLFREAGLDPDLPFNLQAAGTWTWDNFFNIAKQLTRDVNNDGVVDIYGLPCDDAREVMNAFVYGNNGNFVTVDSNGRFQNATNKPEFIEALQFYQRLMNEGVMKNRPESAAWDWDFTEFFDGRTGMLIAPEWRQGQLPEMADDYGMVLPPKGPRANSYRMSLTEVVYVVPNLFTKAEVDVILQAFDLWMTPMDTDWKGSYYWAHRDRRSVDDTMALSKDAANITYRDFAMVPGYPIGSLLMDEGRWWENGTPSQIVESWTPRIQATLDEANR
jgi:ABC-type glycerol-3-phosphate transport system substrate-binding protein